MPPIRETARVAHKPIEPCPSTNPRLRPVGPDDPSRFDGFYTRNRRIPTQFHACVNSRLHQSFMKHSAANADAAAMGKFSGNGSPRV